ncbi:MAG: N-acetylmuramoyl-L-alanine amidase, partial [Syntrophomonadaceae bacterium]|nr:N-acetylmuramoyl-L-alanine amidase [Syntrophomonadaceae bacterium]
WAMDTVPVLKNDRTMVPLRFIGEALGISVGWRPETRTVDIRLPVQSMTGTAVIKEELVNLRSGPGAVFERVGQAVRGDIFTVTGRAGNWYQVAAGAGKEAWVASWLVEVRAGEPALGSRGGDRGGRVPAGQGYLSVGSVQNEGETTSFIVQAGGAKAPRLSLLEEPRRLVLDFAGITREPPNPGEALELKGQLASELHTVQLTPDTARVVVELQGPCSYSVTQVSPGSFLVKIEPPVLQGRLVVIDPGHGNFKSGGWTDPGAIGPRSGLHEADLVLEMGLKVAELLQARGAEVLLTRRGSAWLTLEERAYLANQAGADAFVSIHANSSEDPRCSGSSVYYYAPAGGQRAQRVKLASCLQQQLLLVLGRNDQGVREYDFSVLRHTAVPSALVEVAYLSNPEEERLLGNADFRQKAAEAIAAGITDYLGQSPAA